MRVLIASVAALAAAPARGQASVPKIDPLGKGQVMLRGYYGQSSYERCESDARNFVNFDIVNPNPSTTPAPAPAPARRMLQDGTNGETTVPANGTAEGTPQNPFDEKIVTFVGVGDGTFCMKPQFLTQKTLSAKVTCGSSGDALFIEVYNNGRCEYTKGLSGRHANGLSKDGLEHYLKVVHANDNRCWRFRHPPQDQSGPEKADTMAVVYRLQGCDAYKDRNTLVNWWLQGGHPHNTHYHDENGTHYHPWPYHIQALLDRVTGSGTA